MTSTGTFQGIGEMNRNTSKVLKPPGGGSSDIFGGANEDGNARRVKNHNQSQLSFGEGAKNGLSNADNQRSKPDGNPVIGTGYSSSEQSVSSPVQNGSLSSQWSSTGSEKSNDSSPGVVKDKPRGRVPPGGYSSGLW